MNQIKSDKQKKLIGQIVSDKMDKTRTVEIIEVRRHPLYQKSFNVSSKIKAHDENNEFKAGQKVEIVETRPYSKNKAWKITKAI
jgi:small subunit ribosomal protein S17